MKRKLHLGIILLLLASVSYATAQEGDVSLGDLARSLRKDKEKEKDKEKDKDQAKPAVEPTVIDNDNFFQVLSEAASRKLTGGLSFSFEGEAKSFQVSSPDVTCSLSFNAKATALLSNPYAPQTLPDDELAKLDGPATIQGDTMQLSVYNGSAWNVKEITVGLTLLRPPAASAANYGPKLVSASAVETTTSEKRSDVTMLYHLKGPAAPSTTTVFQETLGTPPTPDQEWHWSIIQAKGDPPTPPTQ